MTSAIAIAASLAGIAAGLLAPAAILVYYRIYDRGYDAGWIQRHLGGPRRPWTRGEPWRGNGLTREELLTLEIPSQEELEKDGFIDIVHGDPDPGRDPRLSLRLLSREEDADR